MSHSLPQTLEVPDGFSYDDAKQYLYREVPKDLWKDAKLGGVLEYMYANKRLRLSEAQREMLRQLALENFA